MANKRNNQMKKIRRIHIIGYQNANKIRNYMKLMDMYGSEQPIDSEFPGNGAIFTTSQIGVNDWLRLSRYIFNTLKDKEY